jgi:hypothetical protein
MTMRSERDGDSGSAICTHTVTLLGTIPTLRGCYKERMKLKLKGGMKILLRSQISCGEYS